MSRERALRWGLLAGAVLVTALLVAGAYNPAPHSGGDNSIYVSLAHSLVANGSYTERFDPAGLPHSKYPPVFPLFLAALIALGAKTWGAMKSVAVVSTVAAVAFIYLWAERRMGSWTALAVAVQHLKKQPERLEKLRPDLPRALCRIVHKMLTKDPAGRYGSARELLKDLKSLPIEGGEDIEAEGLDQISAVDLDQIAPEGNESTQRLAAVMKGQSALKPARRTFQPR